MNKKEVIKEIIAICEPIAESLNYELVDVEYIKEYGSYYLRVYIDKVGGINLDDCQNMSEILSEKLDAKDPISTAYFLEVSSPGLDRPLKTDKDLKRNIGKDVEISLFSIYNNKKNYEGRLDSYNDQNIILSNENEQDNIIEIPRELISVVKLALKF